MSRLFLLEGGKDPFAANAFRFAGLVCPNEIAADPTVFAMPNGKTYLFYVREQGKVAGLVARELASPGKPGEKGAIILPAKKWTDLALSPFRSADGLEAWVAFRGWASAKPLDETKESLMCVQRLDDGLSLDSLLFNSAAELTFLVIQPSGDFDCP